jgi:hypothetical protein
MYSSSASTDIHKTRKTQTLLKHAKHNYDVSPHPGVWRRRRGRGRSRRRPACRCRGARPSLAAQHTQSTAYSTVKIRLTILRGVHDLHLSTSVPTALYVIIHVYIIIYVCVWHDRITLVNAMKRLSYRCRRCVGVRRPYGRTAPRCPHC